jgi:hypothetical protein
MSDSVHLAKYYKMMVPHKAGQGIKLLEHLQQSRVNLLAFLAFPGKNGKAQVDCVPVDPAKFTAAAKKAKWNIKGPKACFERKSTYGRPRPCEVAQDAAGPFCGSTKRM